jgi:hypothetical protein
VSWDKKKSGKGQRFYFYRSGREGEKRVKQYIGAGVVGAQAARHDAEARRHRQEQKQEWQRAWANIEACRGPLDELCHLLGVMVKSVLIVGGLYQHARSEWRRRGVKNA